MNFQTMGIPIRVIHTGIIIGKAVVTPVIIPLNELASIKDDQSTVAVVAVVRTGNNMCFHFLS